MQLLPSYSCLYVAKGKLNLAAVQRLAERTDLKLRVSTRGALNSKENIATIWPVWARSAKLNLQAAAPVATSCCPSVHRQELDLPQ